MRRRLRFLKGTGVVLLACICVMVLLVVGCAKPAPAPEVYEMIFGTTASKSGMYPWLTAHATEANKRVPEVSLTAVEAPGACVENAKRIYAGEVEMGWGGGAQMYRALHGIDEFEGMANPDLRAVAVVIQAPFMYFVRKDSGITSIEELEGKPFGTSFPASITGAKAHHFLDAIGVTPDFFEAAMGANIAAVKDNKIVGYTKTGCPDSSILDIAATIPITILSITEEQYAKFEAKHPGYAEGTAICPAGSYPGQDKDALAYAFFGTWQGTSKTPADVVYKIVKAWYEARADLGAMYKAADKERGQLGFPKLTVDVATIPLHAGAIKFYKELGLTIPSELIPPEAK